MDQDAADGLDAAAATAPLQIVRSGATLVLQLNDCAGAEGMFGAALQAAREDGEVRAVVIAGTGGAFDGGHCGEAEAGEDAAFDRRDRACRSQRWFADLLELEKPVVAAVHGAARNMGFNIALACDFVLAEPGASFTYDAIGGGGTAEPGAAFLLPRSVGLQRAKSILLTGRVVAAPEALALGIVYEIHPSDRLVEEAMALAARFHGASTQALGATKAILNQSFNLDQRGVAELEAYAQAAAMDSAYHRDAAARFVGRQQLPFSWPARDA